VVTNVIPPEVVAGLGGLALGDTRRLVVYVKFFGTTLGGQYVESDNFEFPVDVCAGCLIVFSNADVNPNDKFPNCQGNPSAMNQTVTVPCSGQDGAVDCQACKGYSAFCDPPAIPIAPIPIVDAGGGG
jgi:hypothetical protein